MFESFNTEVFVTSDRSAHNARGVAKLKYRRVRAVSRKPNDGELGYILFVGDRFDLEAPILMGWAPIGRVDSFVQEIQGYAREPKVHLLDFAVATQDAYAKYTEQALPHRWAGKWYQRTPEMMALVQSVLPKDVT